MRLYIYILTLLIFGCENLGDVFEQEDDLPYDYTVAEGWLNFSLGNYEVAEDFFLSALGMDATYAASYTEAYIGLGWSKLYFANTLIGSSYDADRYSLRTESLENFELAYQELQENVDSDDIHKTILFAGLTYSNSVLMLHENYLIGDDSVVNEYAESAIEYSDSLMNIDNEYYFIYDSTNINLNNIHLLRAKTFLQLEDYEKAQDEILQVNFSSTDITFNLDSLYQGPESNYDMYIYIGFRGQDKHLFPMDGYLITRSFTPLLPCLDLIADNVDIANDQIVECLNYMPSNILEYKFAIKIPSLINDDSYYDCQFDWYNNQCVEQWIINFEQLDDNLSCSEDGYRTFEVISNEESLYAPSVCYGSCDLCDY